MYLRYAQGFLKPINKLQAYLHEGTFFNQLLSILLESYFEFLLSAYLHLKFTDDHKTIGLQPRSLQSDILE